MMSLVRVDRRCRRSAPPSRCCRSRRVSGRRWCSAGRTQPTIDDDEQEPELRRHAEDLALAEDEEPFGIAAHRARLADALGEAAIERQRRQRHDQRRHAKRVMIRPLTKPATRADDDREHDREPAAAGRAFCQKTPSRIAERPRIEPTERSMPPVMMTKVIGSGDQPDLGHQPALVEQVGRRSRTGRCWAPRTSRASAQDQREDRLVAEQEAAERAVGIASAGSCWRAAPCRRAR